MGTTHLHSGGSANGAPDAQQPHLHLAGHQQLPDDGVRYEVWTCELVVSPSRFTNSSSFRAPPPRLCEQIRRPYSARSLSGRTTCVCPTSMSSADLVVRSGATVCSGSRPWITSTAARPRCRDPLARDAARPSAVKKERYRAFGVREYWSRRSGGLTSSNSSCSTRRVPAPPASTRRVSTAHLAGARVRPDESLVSRPLWPWPRRNSRPTPRNV